MTCIHRVYIRVCFCEQSEETLYPGATELGDYAQRQYCIAIFVLLFDTFSDDDSGLCLIALRYLPPSESLRQREQCNSQYIIGHTGDQTRVRTVGGSGAKVIFKSCS